MLIYHNDSLINDLPDNKKIMMKTILNNYDNAIYKNITGKNELPKKNSLQYLAFNEHKKQYFKLINEKGIFLMNSSMILRRKIF